MVMAGPRGISRAQILNTFPYRHRGAQWLRGASAASAYADGRTARDQRVRAEFIVNVRDVDFRRGQPLQSLRNIGRPDAPAEPSLSSTI
jgi:hypothetical protein